jgi:hypothetical protein|tara:strand:- start:953 stop:1195 length:243 start_codon:yes stop_codon:yes gene_type:complete
MSEKEETPQAPVQPAVHTILTAFSQTLADIAIVAAMSGYASRTSAQYSDEDMARYDAACVRLLVDVGVDPAPIDEAQESD